MNMSIPLTANKRRWSNAAEMPGPVFPYKLRYIIGFLLVKIAISIRSLRYIVTCTKIRTQTSVVDGGLVPITVEVRLAGKHG